MQLTRFHHRPRSYHHTAVTLLQNVRPGWHTNEVATFSTLSREPARPSRSLSETGVCRPKFASEHSKINDNMILSGFDIENELCFQQHEQKINWLEEVPNRY